MRRDLDEKTQRDVNAVIRATVKWALDHRAEALDHALSFGRGIDRERADRFVGMYVNEFTLDLGPRGEEALRLLLKRGHEAGLISDLVVPEFVG